MLLKTIADKNASGAVLLSSGCEVNSEGLRMDYEYWVTEEEYNDNVLDGFAKTASKYYMHVTSVFDYESSSDAGDGRDDYSKEETDVDIDIKDCIISNNTVVGFLCSAFDTHEVLLIETGKVTVSDPHNYSGRNYHCYRYKTFKLLERA
ncbi:MAG: hypothetical protein E7598_07470 [Ruminococcaceae bacterium]|nr:hypothetical protein [Oscillospiraceae bacterium]